MKQTGDEGRSDVRCGQLAMTRRCDACLGDRATFGGPEAVGSGAARPSVGLGLWRLRGRGGSRWESRFSRDLASLGKGDVGRV